MIITITETAGDTLTGTIDGVNAAFLTSFDFTPGFVNVYVNGRLKVAALDDGFNVIAPRTVVLKEPPLAGDTVAVEYRADAQTGGGALGGVPELEAEQLDSPDVVADENRPEQDLQELEPDIDAGGETVSTLFADGLKPTMLGGNDC